MIMKWLRENVFAACLVTVLRLYLGWAWFSAGWHKIAGDKPFDASGFLKNAIANPVAEKGTGKAVYPIYTAFLEHIALPNVKIINFLIPWGEFLVGLGLLLGTLTLAAAFFGLMMNFMFMFAGTVSTNPWLVLIGTIILVAGPNAGRFGFDFFLIPYLKKMLMRRGKGGSDGKVHGDHPKPLHA